MANKVWMLILIVSEDNLNGSIASLK